MTQRVPAMAVHGGAFAIPPELTAPHRDGCIAALKVGMEILNGGGTSLDAVEAAVVYLENDETFDAGRGSFLNSEGRVEVDAGIMDGHDLLTGSVAAVSGVRNPIRLARRVLESPHAVLVGEGARNFASRVGIPLCEDEELICEREQLRWDRSSEKDRDEDALQSLFGTVGAVAVDSVGDLAAATSTGGYPGKPPGRVGDSPFVGAGVYADNASAAVSATGHGERIIPLVWAKAAADLVTGGLPAPEAATEAMRLLERLKTRAGLILVDGKGNIGVDWNTPGMAYAFTRGEEIIAGPDESTDDARGEIR